MCNFPKQLTREIFRSLPKKLLRNGRLFNAIVYLVEKDGKLWTVKDFSRRPWYVRWSVVPFLLRHEVKILQQLPAIKGIAEHVFFIDRNAIAIEFIPGKSIGQCSAKEIPVSFLLELEDLIRTMHKNYVVHLDLRGGGNVLITPEQHPALIDFQSGVSTKKLPNWLRKLLEDMDLSGVYKKWAKYHPREMGENRKIELARINRWRKFWIFRGYFGIKKKS